MKAPDQKLNKFDWRLHPEAEGFLIKHVNVFLKNHDFTHTLASRIEQETSTRFFDWIDHVVFPYSIVDEKTLKDIGFQEMINVEIPSDKRAFVYPGTIFFPVLLGKKQYTELALKAERLDHFVQVMGTGNIIEGDIHGTYRKAIISQQSDFILSAVERRGYGGFLVPKKVNDTQEYRQTLEAFFCRRRCFENLDEGMDTTQKLIKDTCQKLSQSRVADAFFRAERMYWERRNWISRIQKARQDKFGLGWGNHDHHTFRSSRRNFPRLLKILDMLGFTRREQFFAGEEAGWGAQVLEHLDCNVVVFADIDLSKEEKAIDFSHDDLKQLDRFGTVGLWVELHGESILQAGLHHLAARYDFERLCSDLKQMNLTVMSPFSYFEFLKQAFSEGEMWNVDKKRLDILMESGTMSTSQHETFLRHGAIGSHLENIQRDQGFKGFNQKSVSAIITATNPRTYRQ